MPYYTYNTQIVLTTTLNSEKKLGNLAKKNRSRLDLEKPEFWEFLKIPGNLNYFYMLSNETYIRHKLYNIYNF